MGSTRLRVRYDSSISVLSTLTIRNLGETDVTTGSVASDNNLLFERRACTLVPEQKIAKGVRQAKIIKLQKKIAFLRRCDDQRILLPQNRSKGIDRDLLLIQQRRRTETFEKEVSELNGMKIVSKLSRTVANDCRRHWTLKYNLKFEKLYAKQVPKTNKKDINKVKRRNYKKRRKKEMLEKRENEIKSCIWNRSDRTLTKDEENVLMKGLQFVPTPDITKCYNTEFIQGAKCERRLLWDSVFTTESPEYTEGELNLNPNDNDEYRQLPDKLKIEKHNVPNESDVSDRTKAIVQEIRSSIRNLRVKLVDNKVRQNLSKNERRALDDLSRYEDIVIVNSDKDKKIIILRKNDYLELLKKNIDKNMTPIKGKMDDILKEIKDGIDDNCKTLIEENIISKTLLYATTGLRYNEDEDHHWFTKTRQYAHTFSHKDAFSHSYLLIKSHKIQTDHCPSESEIATTDLPARMVTAGTHAVTTRATTMLELIYQKFVISYIDKEYLRDSFSYLQAINSEEYKNKLSLAGNTINQFSDDVNERVQLYIVAIDVVGLYPNASLAHVQNGLIDALMSASDLNNTQIEALVNLSMFLIESNVMGYQGKPYKNKQGLITGDANSVSLANALVGQITRNLQQQLVDEDYLLLLWRRFIDDGIAHIIGSLGHIKSFIETVRDLFKTIDLEITSRYASYYGENKNIEFLDVQHTFTGPFQYETSQFIKETAKNSLFINGLSWHPQHVYKSIIHAQCYRHEYLHSTKEGFLDGIQRLKTKATRSQFKASMIEDMIKYKIDNYKGQDAILNREKGENDKKDDIIVFSSQFPDFHPTLKNLQSDSGKRIMTTYKKPPSINAMLKATKYRKISTEGIQPDGENGRENLYMQHKCGNGRCALCPMVAPKSSILDSLGNRSYKMKYNLSCTDYGIYVLKCKRCIINKAKPVACYVGRTSTRFNTRFNDHRKNYKEGITKNIRHVNTDLHRDKYALAMHYVKEHPTEIDNGEHAGIKEAYELYLMDKPSKMDFLPHLEDLWLHKIKPTINIQKMTTCSVHEIV